MAFIVAPQIVDAFLDKPIEMEKEQKLLQGVPLDGTEKPVLYTLEERGVIQQELSRLFNTLSGGCVPKQGCKTFTLTAGAPGAGKTTLLNRYQQNLGAVYADPDETVLKAMVPYLEDVSKTDIFTAYTKWRWASNYISTSLMNMAAERDLDIVHGITATGPAVSTLYENVRRAGYEIHTLIVGASEQVRLESARRRFEVEHSRATSPADLIEKGRLFYECLPVYFEKSDRLSVFWRDAADHNSPVLAATAEKGQVTIHNADALRAFNTDNNKNNATQDWPALILTYAARFG